MDMTTATTTSGLEGVVVADTRLSEVDGERGSAKSKHPAFTDKAVRDAMIDKLVV
mgnify:CR=1 FL=1